MPVYIGKVEIWSGDTDAWHTDSQTTEDRATQLLSSIKFKLSHAITRIGVVQSSRSLIILQAKQNNGSASQTKKNFKWHAGKKRKSIPTQKRGLQKQNASYKDKPEKKKRKSCKTFQDFVRLHQVSVCSWSREWIVWTLQDSLSHLGQRLFLSAKSLPTNEKVDSGQEKHYLKWCYCDQWSYL